MSVGHNSSKTACTKDGFVCNLQLPLRLQNDDRKQLYLQKQSIKAIKKVRCIGTASLKFDRLPENPTLLLHLNIT